MFHSIGNQGSNVVMSVPLINVVTLLSWTSISFTCPILSGTQYVAVEITRARAVVRRTCVLVPHDNTVGSWPIFVLVLVFAVRFLRWVL